MALKLSDIRRILPLSLAGLVLILVGIWVSSLGKLEPADGIHRENTSSPSPEQVERRAGGDFSDPAQATNMAPGEPRLQRSENLVVDRPNVEESVLGGRAEPINSEEDFVVDVIPVEIDHEELKRAQRREISELSLDIGLPEPVVAEIARVASKSRSVFVLQGGISGIPGSEFSISVYENVAVGSFRGEGIGLRELSYAGEAGNMISLIDLTKFPGCGSCIAALEEEDETPERLEGAGDEDPGLPAVEEDSAFSSVIDVMIVYTREARESKGGTAAILALCNQGIEDTNLAFQNSNIDAQVYLVHTVEVEYTESDGSTALDALRSSSDGVIDNVHSLRNQYGADCVSLFINYSTSAGRGYLMKSESTSFASNAFSIVDPDAVGGLTLTHELGHNWGCHHAVGDESPDPLTRGEAIFDYAHGWRWNNNANRSIMAYTPGTRVRYFSNPNVIHSGFPTGRSNLEDNARTINQTRDTVELFRPTVTDMTLSDTSQAFSESGGLHSFEVVTNTAWNWSKPESAGWIVSTESVDQNGTRTFSYSVNSNTSPAARSAAISISDGTQTRTHEVSQDGSASADDAYEENDTLATAFDFTQEQEWLSALQGLGIQSDNDWYRISASPSGYEHVRVDCRFTHAEGDVDIYLYDSSGTRLAGSTSTSDNEIIDYQVSAAGTYYILVSYENKGNTYDLWWDDLPTLTISDEAQDFGFAGGTHNFDVVTKGSWSWLSSSGADWVTSGESPSQIGDQSFSYSVADNPLTSPRTAEITLTNGTYTRVHTITQGGRPALADLVHADPASAPTSLVAGAGFSFSSNVRNNGTVAAGAFRINCYLSVDTSFSASDIFLGSVSIPGADVNQTVPYSVTLNVPVATPEGRYYLGWIIDAGDAVTESNESNSIYFTRLRTVAGAGESLVVSPTTRSIGAGGGDGTFSVSSNTTWSWSDNAAWLTSNESTSQNGNQTFSYSVAPNPSTQERTAIITITAGTVTRTHTVTQAGAGVSLAISPTTRSIGAGSGNGAFTVSSNTNWSWSSSAAWLTSNKPTSQSGNQTFSYSVAPNPSTQERTAIITITAGTITRTHTVTQVVPTNVLVNTTPVAANANVSYFIPNNGALGDTWQQPGFDDSSWKNVPHPLGFESSGGTLEPLIATNIKADMETVNAGGYFRFPFQVNASRGRILSATLNVTIDDGYVAYLNGVEVARFNAPTPINWNSPAIGSRGDSTVLSTKLTTDISSHLDAIVDGENILAIQAMNASSGSSDFLLGVELTAVERKPESLDPAETTVDALGGELSFAVNVVDGVDWTAESEADWLTITGGANGTGPATYQYYRFTTTQTAGDSMIQVSEFDLINDGNKVDYTNLTVSNPGGNSPGGEEPAKVIDGDTSTKWLDFNIAPLVFTFNAPVTIDSYNFATANDALGRTPISWTLKGSDDGATWIEIDSRSSVTPPGSFFTFFDNAFDFADLPTDGANGAGVGTVTYTVEPNPSTEERSATISITAGNLTLTHTVTQEGDTDTPIFDLNVSTSRLASGAIERVTVSFPTSITAVYSIEGSADMRTWVTLEAGINGNDNIIERSFPVVDAMRHHGFYRIRWE